MTDQVTNLQEQNEERMKEIFNDLALNPDPEDALSEEELREFGIELDKEDKLAI